MDPVHVHLLLNHAPTVGTAVVIFFLAWGLLRRAREVEHVALVATILVALVTLLVGETGESAAHAVRALSWVDRARIHTHAEWGDATRAVLVGAGVLAAGALWLTRGGRTLRWPAAVVLLALCVGFGLASWASWTGGLIRHDELRTPAPQLQLPTTPSVPGGG